MIGRPPSGAGSRLTLHAHRQRAHSTARAARYNPHMHRRSFLGALAATAFAQPAAKTTAERLNRAGARLLMVHADDAGMCHSVNLATSEALLSSSVQSASIMVPCPWFSEIADLARRRPDLDLGLHLTLTSEWRHYRWRPVAPPDKVKGLLDSEGYLWRDVISAAGRATPAEVEIELRAQLDRARQFGVQFTHVDSHMGTLFARPDFFEVYTKVAREARVVCMLPRPTPEAAAELAEYPITADMLNAKERDGFVLLDRLITGVPGSTVEARKQSYRALLRNLKPGVTKLIVHLAKDDPEIRAVTNAWQQRWADFLFWTSSEAKALMKELDIQPVTYRELGKLL
jgi:chitin disaccharide deacetylase